MANYDLSVHGVYGVGPNGARLVQATMGDALFLQLCKSGSVGLASGILGGVLPLLGLSALPSDAFLIDSFGSGCAVGSSYSDLSVSDDDSSRTVYLSDPGGSSSDPCPNFKAWCEGLGGTYSDDA